MNILPPEEYAERDRDGYIILKPRCSELYKHQSYSTPLTYIQNSIIEYDIKAANWTMLKQTGQFDKQVITMLGALSRDAREVAVGNIIRKKPEVYQIISRGIRKARHRLFMANNIQDQEVLSIRNDAVFIIGRRLKITQFGDVLFREKNRYALFHRLEKIEFLYDKRHQKTDVKGVSDKVVNHPDHQHGIMEFFNVVFKYLCYDQREALCQYLIQFARDYKALRLPVQYYRELNAANAYRTKYELSGFSFNMTVAGESDKEIINPIYNYKRFILPLIWQYT